ncbi:dehydration-responsive element-binding protein 1C-like [Triticum urartu]|uniref:AP2/ERF domain-containing protein n=1 Tax=Triticum urartu TaxID=4572 RepID=A0A8R7QUG4_TRIUA|nr:dehydration-responsive element-binding protein 1C-like [Triticum urartu]
MDQYSYGGGGDDNGQGGYATVTSAPPKRPAGRTKFRETRHPVYRGVRRRGAAGRWVCEVREPNKKSRIWLGTFASPEAAARAHDVAALALRGRAACLNFADSAALLAVDPATLRTPDDIRAAAIALAETACPAAPASSSAVAAVASAPAPPMMTMMHESAAVHYDDYPMQYGYGGIGGLDQDSYYYDGMSAAGGDWQSGSHMDGADEDCNGSGGYGAGEVPLWSY